MDKKKVKELIEQIQKYCDQAYNPNWQPKSFEEFIKLGNICREAIKEINKSDWVSVEDGLPPYGEEVFVTSKMSPDNVFKNRRVESTTVPKDGNDFIILWEGRMARITHWKPIDKLED